MLIFGLALIPILIQQSSLPIIQSSLRLPLVGFFYIDICLLGISAVFYPKRCKSIFNKSQNPIPEINSPLIKIAGHHPDCQSYSGNRIRFRGRIVCAACTGLLIGGLAACLCAISYFFIGFSFPWNSLLLLVLGEVCILLGLAQIKTAGVLKVFVNAVFVIGSSITLIETDVLAGSMLVDFYVIGLIAFALWIRIALSEWNNRRICKNCQSCSQ
jgi:hypothetical protein